ncbi:swr complex subunit [Dinochytrium kinnereticum]|nr:swr complex subunit [Dinochytrium kinnereticum]
MASAADVRDILSLPQSSGPPAPRQRHHQPIQKRPEGITRELFALTGGLPPLTFSVVPNAALKPKINFGSDGKEVVEEPVQWKWLPFKNPARTDELELSHWIRYSDASTDPDWTFEETRYLLELCKLYDLRFIVISDRFEFESKSRSIEDLKDRYYTVTKKIHSVRNDPIDSETAQYSFNKEREIERKKNLEILYSRTPEIQKEEELLYTELRRREQNEKKWAIERERILRLFSNHELSSPINLASSHAGSVKKTKKIGSKADEGGNTSDAVPNPLRKDRKSSMKLLDDAADSSLKREKIPPGVYLRTSRLFAPKQSMQVKVKEIMDEYGLPTVPTLPTALVCDRFDTLRMNILNMLELKKVVDRQEYELRVLEGRRDHLVLNGPSPAPAAGGIGSSDVLTPSGVMQAFATAQVVTYVLHKLKKRSADGSSASRDIKRQKSTAQ